MQGESLDVVMVGAGISGTGLEVQQCRNLSGRGFHFTEAPGRLGLRKRSATPAGARVAPGMCGAFASSPDE